MKLSTRNVLNGKVLDVKEGTVMAKVKVDLGCGNIVSSLVSLEAVKDLDIKVGDDISVLIKATSVMLAK
ncbi:MAG: TOBE domain-containing protein [Syntrophobacteraceae bacterium]